MNKNQYKEVLRESFNSYVSQLLTEKQDDDDEYYGQTYSGQSDSGQSSGSGFGKNLAVAAGSGVGIWNQNPQVRPFRNARGQGQTSSLQKVVLGNKRINPLSGQVVGKDAGQIGRAVEKFKSLGGGRVGTAATSVKNATSGFLQRTGDALKMQNPNAYAGVRSAVTQATNLGSKVATSGAGKAVSSGLGVVARAAGPVMGAAMSGYDEWTANSKNGMGAGENIARTGARAAGAAGGAWGGAALGAGIGTAILPGVGTVIGGALGGLAGWWAGDKVGDVAGDVVGGASKGVSKGAGIGTAILPGVGTVIGGAIGGLSDSGQDVDYDSDGPEGAALRARREAQKADPEFKWEQEERRRNAEGGQAGGAASSTAGGQGGRGQQSEAEARSAAERGAAGDFSISPQMSGGYGGGGGQAASGGGGGGGGGAGGSASTNSRGVRSSTDEPGLDGGATEAQFDRDWERQEVAAASQSFGGAGGKGGAGGAGALRGGGGGAGGNGGRGDVAGGGGEGGGGGTGLVGGEGGRGGAGGNAPRQQQQRPQPQPQQQQRPQPQPQQQQRPQPQPQQQQRGGSYSPDWASDSPREQAGKRGTFSSPTAKNSRDSRITPQQNESFRQEVIKLLTGK